MDPPGAVQGRRLQKAPRPSNDQESLYRPKDSVSHENLQLRAIFDRLGEIALNPHPHEPECLCHSSLTSKLNTRCSCGNVTELSPSRGHHRNGTGPATSTISSDSDLDSDDEVVSLVAVIGMLVAQERKGSARQLGAIKNLAACCHGDAISETHLHQLVRLTSTTNQQVKQAAFLALRQAATNEQNAKVLLQMNLVLQLLTLLQDKMEAASHATAAAVLEKLVMHRKLTDHWLERMITQGLSILIGSLSSANQAAETKVALGRLLSNLAEYFEIAVLLLDHCMEDVMEMWLRYPAMKENLAQLFNRLVQHTDHTVAGVLEHRVMEHVSVALKEETCLVQIRAAEFFQALCSSDYGLSAFLDDGNLRGLLQVLRATHCRRLRELCVATLRKSFQRASPNQLRDVTLHTEAAFSQESALPQGDLGGRRRGKEEQGHLASRKKDASSRSERGVRVLISILVEAIHKEAKITLDQNKKVKSVGFRPGVDLYNTLSDSVSCLCHLATMTVGLQRNRTSSQNAKVSIVGSEKSKGKARKVNTEIVGFMFQQGALCVLDLIYTYTLHLFPSTGMHSSQQQQRNVDVLHLQAMMKVWQMVSPSSLANPLPSDEELHFVKQLLECAYLLCKCSAELWNSNIEKAVKEQLEENQNWTREPALEETSVGHYQYVKTVDQAFPTSCEIDNISTHRQEMNEIKEQRMNAIYQRRKAWGDQKEPRTSGEGPSSQPQHLSRNASGDSPKVSNKMRPSSAKRHNPEPEMKFDLSKSVFREQAKSSPSSRQREVSRVTKNVRTCGYAGKTAPTVPKLEAEEKCAIGDEKKKEVHKKLRSKLFQEGVCETMGPWMACEVPQIQVLAAECLRCVVQPLHLEKTKQLRESAQAKVRQNRHRSRSEMAKTLAERDKILSQVLGQMSTGSANVVRDALGVKGQTEREPAKMGKGSKLKTKPLSDPTNHKPTCTSDEPIGWQSSIHLLEMCGSQVLKGLSSDSSETKRACLLLLYDLVDFGEIVIHMKLASLGVVSQLMDFLRSNRQEQDLAMLAVMTLRQLICDYRLKQIFCSEGGEALLTDLIKTSEGALLKHLHQFLKDVTEGPGGLL